MAVGQLLKSIQYLAKRKMFTFYSYEIKLSIYFKHLDTIATHLATTTRLRKSRREAQVSMVQCPWPKVRQNAAST